MATKEIYDVPADQVDTYVRLFKENGATDVRVNPQPDDKFTLIVTYPDFESHDVFKSRLIAAGNPALE